MSHPRCDQEDPMDEPSDSAISVRGLKKTYPGGIEAVKGIDFDVRPGEVFGLLGPNGAGKSTTVGMLTTTIAPTAGQASLGGVDVARDPLAARRMSSVVFQEPVVDRLLSGRRHLDLHARLWGVDPTTASQRIQSLGGSLGLTELLDRTVGSYSGGQRRRLEIARALMSEPSVLFLDEPTVGLDPRIRHELLDVIGGLRASGDLTILLTTHYLDEAERLCDRVAIIHRGRIVALDTPGVLLAGLGRELLELRVEGDVGRVMASLRANGIGGDDAFAVGSTVALPLHDLSAAQAIADIDASGLAPASIATRRPTLDDVYLRLTGDRLAEAS